jgi:mono/diheme cytochrome c family protein
MQFQKAAHSLGWTVVFFTLSGFRCPAEVDFTRDIKPLLQRCLKCHGPEKAKSRFRLDNRASAIKGGADGVAIIPGNSADSPLIHLVEDQDMPPPGKGKPLTKPEVARLRSWIDQGASWANAAAKPREAAVRPRTPEQTTPTVPNADAPTEVVESLLPPAAGQGVDFTRDIHPILQRNCLKCHGPEKPRSSFRLDNRTSALKGGSGGVAIIPGNSADSPLIHLVSDQDMPPKGAPLTDEEVALLRAWIDQGANWGDTVDTPNFAFSITPTVQRFSVSGNEQKFREHAWMQEGWTGGGRFTLENWIDRDTKFTAEGSAHGPANIDLTLALNRQDVGFVRGGVEQFRRYYNNFGGHYAPFAISAFRSNRELHLDSGRVWTEIGFHLPDWPEITLGYEFRFREGMKSTLHWGQSTQGGQTRAIYPAYKQISEAVHIFRGDVRYDWAGLVMENNFMAEFFDLDTRRFEVSPQSFGAVPDTFTTTSESHEAFQLTNTFSLQKQIKDWWMISGGYYYSYLDADASFQQNTLNGQGSIVVGQHWFSQPIVLDWNAHIFNVSTMLGPWEGLTLSAGVQNNWERQSSVGTSTLFFGLPDPMIAIPPFFVSTVSSRKQSVTTTEHASLRYDRIPHTILFAEAELEQESTDYFEQDPGAFQGFLRESESWSTDQDCRAGINLSPWPRVSLNSHYRYRLKKNRYDHLRNETAGGAPNLGYSGFILGRDIETHEFRTRLNLRPRPWLRTMLTYQMQATDYVTDTDAVIVGLPSDTAGGALLAGEYDTRIYRLNVVLTPWQRLAMNGTFSFQDSRTRTANNADPAVDDFEGDIYSVLFGGTFRVDDKTEIAAHYSFSRGDFSQKNSANGLPLGIEYQQHGLQAGIATQIGDHLRAQLQYQFQHYQEPSAGNFNNYTAHGVFLNCTLNWE